MKSPTSRRRPVWRSLPLLALTALAALGVDCSQERAPIDQTHQGALAKTFFIGANYHATSDDPEFYMENYVVDAPADQSLVPVGTYDDVDRIRWEVQENLLIARKAYEYVTGADGHGLQASPTENGVIVAAYHIDAQFDIRHAYNPSTGEELNVLTENTTDRNWYERDYIRVDWSRNLVDNPGWGELFYGSLFGGLSFSPVAYDVTDPTSPDAPNVCEMTAGMVRGTNGGCVRDPNSHHPGGYFDVTSRWLVNPETSNLFEEPIPTCLIANFFAGSPVYSCSPQETTIRTSFRRVVDRDFEPLENTRAPYDLVGGPTAERTGYDPGYGITDANFHRYQMIHNLWQQSHLSPIVACTSNVDADNNGTADACPVAHPGSQCDTITQRCTVPYRERTVRPIAYYVNPQMPAEMQNHVTTPGTDGADTYRLPTASDAATTVVHGPSEQIIDSWNLAIMAAVANAREVECRRTGGARDVCHAQYFEAGTDFSQAEGAWLASRAKATNGPAVVLCHNPVLASDDHTACRETGYSVRLGDIRYNHLTYWNGESRAPFGGIAHWGYDPLTGEVVSNGAFNMARSVDYAAAQQRDYILLAMGDLTVDDFVAGAAAQRFAQLVRNPATGVPGRMSDAEVTARMHAVDGMAATQSMGLSSGTSGSASAAAVFAQRQTLLMDTSTPPAGSSQTAVRYDAAAARLRNTSIEADLVDDHWLANLGFNPNAARSQTLLNQVSPLRKMDPEVAESTRETLMRTLERRGFCFQDMGAPPTIGSEDLQGVARWFQHKYGALPAAERARRIYNDLRAEAFKGIAIHEVGHSLGLYHVPVSSYDSMNYNPQYWQLRTHEGTSTGSCTPQCNLASCPNTRSNDRNADNCMGPRYLDPPSDEELGIADTANPHAGINYFGNTSVMEYQWERFGETVGIGSYDHYAMGLLYGRVVETMESDPAQGGMTIDQQVRFAPRLQSQLADQDQISFLDPVLNQTGVLPVHYTELARQMHVFDISRCRDATPDEIERYRWRVVDGKLCRLAPRDHAALVDFESGLTHAGSTQVAPNWHTVAAARTGGSAVRWGYRVAWDIGTGYPHINYFDQGADLYEVAQSGQKKYDLSYPAMYFRRGNRDFNTFAIPGYLARTIFRRLRGYHWSIAYNSAYYAAAFDANTYAQISADDNWLRPYLMTGPLLFDFFATTLLRPEVGDFSTRSDQLAGTRTLFDVLDTPDAAHPPQFQIGVIDGRFIGEQYDNTAGGSWDYFHWITRTGSYPEKPIAAIMLTDTRPTFSSITRSLFLDGREFQVNFHTDMAHAFDRLLGGILAEDWDTVAMHVPTVSSSGTDLVGLQPQILPLWTPPTRSDPSGTPVRPSGSRLVFPDLGYRQELPTVVYSMLFSSLNSDLSTIHRMRIWVEGGPEQINVPEADRTRFSNPETGITYVARRYGPDAVDGLAIDRGIASRMIAHANRLLIDTYQVQVDAMLQPVVNADGSLTVITNATTGQPTPANTDPRRQAAAVTRFRNYVGLIDATRYSAQLLGFGTLN